MPRKQDPGVDATSSLDDWTKQAQSAQGGGRNCVTCRSPYRETLQALLQAIIKRQAYSISRRQVYSKLKELCPDYGIRFRAFETHLDNHEGRLWQQAKGASVVSKQEADASKEQLIDEWVVGQKDAVKAQLRAMAAKIANLTAENARLAKQLGLVEAYHAGAGTPPRWMAPTKRPKVGSATACLQFSDLHLDEVVDPNEVGGLNAYSREIAELRLRRWANKACEMGDRFKHSWDGALLFWGGDMVSGSIHEELRETNADLLPGTIDYWAPRIASAIRQVADFYGRVHVPCVVGNHGRLTTKMPAKRRGRMSWDWLLAKLVASHFKEDERVTFEVAQGSYLFVPVYETHAFLTHGDEAGGGNGWSGVWTPLMTISRKGAEMGLAHGFNVSYSVIGHWHQTVLAHHRGISCNGSMKGWDEYAASMRLRPEPAMQNFWVHTPDYGVTMSAPLFLVDRKGEAW